jgi:hypothetical protein
MRRRRIAASRDNTWQYFATKQIRRSRQHFDESRMPFSAMR